MTLVARADVIDLANPIAVGSQSKPEDKIVKKISSINAEKIDLVCKQITDTVANKLGIDPKALYQVAISDIRPVVERSFSIPLEFIGKGFSFKLSTSEPAGFLADIVSQKKIELDVSLLPRNYRVSVDLNQELTQARDELTFIQKELSGEKTLSEKVFHL